MNRSVSFSISFAAHATCVGLLLLACKPASVKPVVMVPCHVTLFTPGPPSVSAPRSVSPPKAPVRPRPRAESPSRPRPRPVIVTRTRKVPRRTPSPPTQPTYSYREVAKLDAEKVPPIPRSNVREEAAPGKLTVSTGGTSSFDAYIARIIKGNWARPSRTVVGDNPPPVSVAIRIGVDGKITSTRITGSSGIHLLDASAEKAIQRSNPLPIGLPGYMARQYYDVTIVFQITNEA